MLSPPNIIEISIDLPFKMDGYFLKRELSSLERERVGAHIYIFIYTCWCRRSLWGLGFYDGISLLNVLCNLAMEPIAFSNRILPITTSPHENCIYACIWYHFLFIFIINVCINMTICNDRSLWGFGFISLTMFILCYWSHRCSLRIFPKQKHNFCALSLLVSFEDSLWCVHVYHNKLTLYYYLHQSSKYMEGHSILNIIDLVRITIINVKYD